MYACHSTLLFYFIFYLFSFFFSFLVFGRVVLWWWWYYDSLLVITTVPIDVIVHSKDPLYIACRLPWLVFTILASNHFCLGLSVFPDHPLVCQLFSHHHLPMLAVPLPITRQRKLFYLFTHRGILILHSVGILSCYLSWHAPSGSS